MAVILSWHGWRRRRARTRRELWTTGHRPLVPLSKIESCTEQRNALPEVLLKLLRLSLSKRSISGARPTVSSSTNVLVHADRLFSEPLQNRRLVPKAVEPVSKGLEHFALNLGFGIVEIRMEQALQNLFCDLLRRNRGIIPSVCDQRNAMYDDNFCNETRWFVRDCIKVVFAQEGMGWIRSERIVENFILVMVINNFPGD